MNIYNSKEHCLNYEARWSTIEMGSIFNLASVYQTGFDYMLKSSENTIVIRIANSCSDKLHSLEILNFSDTQIV